MLTFLSTPSVCCRRIPPLFTKRARTASWTCLVHCGCFTLACINYLQCVYIEIMEALWYRPFTHYEQIPMCFTPSSSSVETLTEISAVPLGVIECDSTWGKAFGVDLVFFTLKLIIISTESFVLFFFFFVIDSDLSTTTTAVYWISTISTTSTAKVIFFLTLPFHYPQHRMAPIYFSEKHSTTLTKTGNTLWDQNLKHIYRHICCTLMKVLPIKKINQSVNRSHNFNSPLYHHLSKLFSFLSN